jgi:hypothetical protein
LDRRVQALGGLVDLGDAHAGRDRLGVEVHLFFEIDGHARGQDDLEFTLRGLVVLVVLRKPCDLKAQDLVGIRVEEDRNAIGVGDR